MKRQYYFFLMTLLLPSSLWAIEGESYISTSKGTDNFTLFAAGKSTTLFISSKDYTEVIRALKDLKANIGRETNIEPSIL